MLIHHIPAGSSAVHEMSRMPVAEVCADHDFTVFPFMSLSTASTHPASQEPLAVDVTWIRAVSPTVGSTAPPGGIGCGKGAPDCSAATRSSVTYRSTSVRDSYGPAPRCPGSWSSRAGPVRLRSGPVGAESLQLLETSSSAPSVSRNGRAIRESFAGTNCLQLGLSGFRPENRRRQCPLFGLGCPEAGSKPAGGPGKKESPPLS